MREKIAYRTVQVLSQGASYRDEIIQVGLYRSNPCTHPLRMVSVLWREDHRAGLCRPPADARAHLDGGGDTAAVPRGCR